MKTSSFIIYVIAVLLLIGFYQRIEAQDYNAKAAQETDQPRGSANTDTEQREQYKKEIEDRLAEFRVRINKLKEQAKRAGAKAQAELRDDVTKLENKMTVANREFEKFKSGGARMLEKARSELDATIRDIERSYKQLVAKLKRSNSEEEG